MADAEAQSPTVELDSKPTEVDNAFFAFTLPMSLRPTTFCVAIQDVEPLKKSNRINISANAAPSTFQKCQNNEPTLTSTSYMTKGSMST
jgi:hypothetical protein